MGRRSRRQRPEREEQPRSGADAGGGRREDLVRCKRAREELMEAHHREQQQIGVVRARRLEGSGNLAEVGWVREELHEAWPPGRSSEEKRRDIYAPFASLISPGSKYENTVG